MKGPIIETNNQVMFYDTDAAGVVHNIAYLRYIEENRTLLGIELGLDYKEMSKEKKYGAVVRTEIDYKSPALLGDNIIVRGWLSEMAKVRFWCHFETLFFQPIRQRRYTLVVLEFFLFLLQTC